MHFDPTHHTQFLCLSVLTGVYFAGLLLKTRAMAQDSGIGVLLVTTLVSVVVAAFALAIAEFRTGLKHLRKILHNFDILYPGHIPPVEGLDCVASFPGKFAKGWDKVVRLGGKQRKVGKCAQEVDGAQLSVACVFFTQHTPKFGQHGINPDTGKCWCYNLYGESKCWGCQVSSA